MRLSDETLVAYADGILDEEARAQVELAMQADPGVAARVRQCQALRQQGRRAHGGGGTPPPPRPKIIQLDSVRASRRQPAAAAASPPPQRAWPHWLALGLAVLLGAVVGVAAVTAYHSEIQFAGVNGHGLLRAHGKLDNALDSQLTSNPQPAGNLRIGVSFVSRDGQYCRVFELGAAAGLACRAGAGWNIPVLVEGQGAAGTYRPVGSPMPAAVLAAIDARALGPALDAAAERAAAARNWSR